MPTNPKSMGKFRKIKPQKQESTDRFHHRILLEACQKAYRKHHIGDETIGWEELAETLANTLAEVMGDKSFVKWLEKVAPDRTVMTK